MENNKKLTDFENEYYFEINSYVVRDKDLIEFRTPNMTSDPIYWQNYINTFYHLLKCAASPRYDKEEIDKYIDAYSRIYILESYEMLREDKAKKFVKTIFNSNVDKSQFMHQYIGRRP